MKVAWLFLSISFIWRTASTLLCTFCDFISEIYSPTLMYLWTLRYDHSSSGLESKVSDAVRFMTEELFQENYFYSNIFQADQA